MVELNKIEPYGEGECPECNEEGHLLYSPEEDVSKCPKCWHDFYGDEFLSEWIIGAGVVGDMEKHGDFVSYDFGFDIDVSFRLKYKKRPKSNHPGETRSERVPVVKSNTAIIHYKNEKLGEVKAKNWAKYTQEQIRD